MPAIRIPLRGVVGPYQCDETPGARGVPFITTVATFPDPNAGPYTALVDWGDGVTNNGGFSSACSGSTCTTNVNAEHFYAKVGTYAVVVHVFSLIADGSGGAAASVKAAPLQAPTGLTIGMVPNQPFNGVVGGFADADLFATPANYRIDIDWGDSQTSSGTAVPVAICCATNVSNFNIVGQHTYQSAGTYSVTATVTDILGGPQPIPNNVIARSVIYAPVIETFNSNATEGAFSQTTLSRIPLVNINIGHQKIIDWGDGTVEGPTPVAQGCFTAPDGSTDCFWLAGGGHTYAEEGNYTVTTTYNGSDGSGGTAQTLIVVGDAQLTNLQANVLPVTPGKSFDGIVAPSTASRAAELRTYAIDDVAGNTTVVVIKAARPSINQDALKARVISMRYGKSALVSLGPNLEEFNWQLAQDRSLASLDQKFRAGVGPSRKLMDAHYTARQDRTDIVIRNPQLQPAAHGHQ